MKKLIVSLCIFLFIPLISLNGQVKAVRGVWLTNVDSEVLDSKKNIAEAVDLCSSMNINTIFTVVWNKGFTLYPSKIMKELYGTEIYPQFAGRDPLKELIEEAHKKNIKVIAWFEFGFSSSYKLDGGIILKLHPEWAAIDNTGELVVKNGFEWMNGFDPAVQDFMLSLLLEVVENYNVDGIQGDDRLPAMPSEAGYDDYTLNLYRKEHNNSDPPWNFKDSSWIQWRADILNKYMGRIYRSVKKTNKNIIVSMSPSIYPWSKEEYLQDWPEWIKNGYVDLVIPQLYRYDFPGYKKLLDEIINDQINKKNIHKFYPGILLKLGDYYPSIEFLEQIVSENRKNDINGEVFFFYEGLKKYPEFFAKIYNEKAEFPNLMDSR